MQLTPSVSSSFGSLNHSVRVLHVLSTPRAEGTVRLALDWLRTGMHEQHVFVLSAKPAELSEQLRATACTYAEEPEIPVGRRKFPWMVERVRVACLRVRPDVVISWNNGFGAFVLAGAWAAGVPHLITYGGNPPDMGLKQRFHTAFTTWMTALVGGEMICCSRYVQREFLRSAAVVKSVLRAAPNCANLETIRARAEAARARVAPKQGRKRLLMVATLERHKDHATLLRAVAHAGQAASDWEVLIAGNGSLRSNLEDLARELRLNRIVSFLGTRDDVPELLGSSDLFVFSTTPQEGLGTVLIEALAAGIRIVASDVPACREVLQHGKWGMLVPPADPAALAKALIDALERPEWANDDVWGYLEHFSPESMMQEYLAPFAAKVL